MNWFDVDGAREHLTRPGAKRPSRKVVYAMVSDGLRVARSGRRIWFCEAWINDYMESKAQGPVLVSTPTDRLDKRRACPPVGGDAGSEIPALVAALDLLTQSCHG